MVLDSWRGICACLVALHHLPVRWSFYSSSFVNHSRLFVDFFFVLSGFVISHAYGSRLNGVVEIFRFYIRRVGRVWPLHAAVIGVLFFFQLVALMLEMNGHYAGTHDAFSGPWDPDGIIPNLFLVQAWWVVSKGTWNGPSWSISTEFAAYLVYGAACLARRGVQLYVFMFIAMASAVLVAIVAPDGMDSTLGWGVFRCLYGFFLGAICYQFHLRWPTRTAYLEIPAVIAVGVYVAFLGYGGYAYAAPMLFAVTVAIFARETGPISRILGFKPFRRLGEWSYSIYMVHILVIAVLIGFVRFLDKIFKMGVFVQLPWHELQNRSLMDLGSAYSNNLACVAYLLVVVAVAYATYMLIERPGRDAFNRMARSFGRT